MFVLIIPALVLMLGLSDAVTTTTSPYKGEANYSQEHCRAWVNAGHPFGLSGTQIDATYPGLCPKV